MRLSLWRQTANDLHMFQLIQVTTRPRHLLLHQNRERFVFLMSAYPGSPREGAVKRCLRSTQYSSLKRYVRVEWNEKCLLVLHVGVGTSGSMTGNLSMPVASPCKAECQRTGRYSTRPTRPTSESSLKCSSSIWADTDRMSSTAITHKPHTGAFI